ncbi:unnamed protein product [Aureobasidium mustum]|uniref:Tricorn protease domain 2-containing protein n=1 Tax=Aureobasidium mustum TaxID=2773714 RepID=A0A9N8JZU7_9PEZI|nr:unnamed protein product [Aureobasidium mustum]
MALTIAGTHLALGPLLSGCYSIVKGINQLRQSYNFMPLTLTSIVLTCNTTSSTLNKVDSTLAEYSGTARDLTQELFEQFDGIKIGCTMTLSLLERHVSDLLDTASSEMPLKAQKASRTDNLKALYNESDMKELFGQLKDYNALLNTILNQLLSDKQNTMIDMMTNQEKTLKTMFQAQNSLRRFLHDGPVDKETDTASILSSTTSGTALTAFDFDSIIKSTAVYKRCMNRRGDEQSLLECLRGLTVQYDPARTTDGAATDERGALTSMQSHHKILTETIATPREDHVMTASRSSPPPRVFAYHPRPFNNEAHAKSSAVPLDSSDPDTTYGSDASDPEDVPPMRLSDSGRTISDHVKKVVDTRLPHSETIFVPSSKHDSETYGPQSVEENRHAPPHARSTLLYDIFSGIWNIASHMDRGRTTKDWFWIFEPKEETISVAVSSNHLLAAATRNGILIWNMCTGEELAKISCIIEANSYPGVIFSLRTLL